MAARAPLGIGIVGCGVIARAHLRALLRFPGEARVVALASRSPDSIAGAAEYLRTQAEADAAEAPDGLAELLREQARRTPAGYEEYRDLVADPTVDVVIVTTPPFLHHQAALAALRAERHVLCEKPLATSLRQADELI